jgi:hypothetical protein
MLNDAISFYSRAENPGSNSTHLFPKEDIPAPGKSQEHEHEIRRLVAAAIELSGGSARNAAKLGVRKMKFQGVMKQP